MKVIVTSAYSQEEAEIALGEQQPSFYIRKPYQLNELTSLVRESSWTMASERVPWLPSGAAFLRIE